MAGFLYFIPNPPKQTLDEKDFQALGLGYALTVGGPDCRGLGEGPEGRGVLAVPILKGATRPTHYKPAEQEWRKAPGGKFWVGYWKDAPPTPADLQKPKAIMGDAVMLRDGNLWTVPRCMAFFEGRPTTLPLIVDIDAAGNFFGPVAPEYRDLCDRVHAFWRMRYAGGEKIPMDQLIALAIDALAVNYRLSRLEVALLGLLEDSHILDVLKAAVDGDEIERRWEAENQKKSTFPSDASSMNSGAPDTSPATDPPSRS